LKRPLAGRSGQEAIEMRSRSLKVLGGLALAALVGAAAAVAQQAVPEGRTGRGPRRGPGPVPPEAVARVLGLTDAQKAQVQKLMGSKRTEHEALREKVEANQQQLRAALESASPDPAAVGELVIEGHRLREQGKALREAQEAAIRSVLTPEQQVKFDVMKSLREEAGPTGHGRPVGFGPPPDAEGPQP
jgi:Spy/CpxP family protein refolding chaperone